jgi:hypothetical protein
MVSSLFLSFPPHSLTAPANGSISAALNIAASLRYDARMTIFVWLGLYYKNPHHAAK